MHMHAFGVCLNWRKKCFVIHTVHACAILMSNKKRLHSCTLIQNTTSSSFVKRNHITKPCNGQLFSDCVCICCGSILSLVQILLSFVFGYGTVIYDNEFKTKENKI